MKESEMKKKKTENKSKWKESKMKWNKVKEKNKHTAHTRYWMMKNFSFSQHLKT